MIFEDEEDINIIDINEPIKIKHTTKKMRLFGLENYYEKIQKDNYVFIYNNDIALYNKRYGFWINLNDNQEKLIIKLYEDTFNKLKNNNREYIFIVNRIGDYIDTFNFKINRV